METVLPNDDVIPAMYGPPRDCKGKAKGDRQVCANVFDQFSGEQSLLAELRCVFFLINGTVMLINGTVM